MIYDLSEDQRLFRDAIGGFLGDAYSDETRRSILASSEGFSPPIWRQFAEDVGLLGAGLPEHAGGMGGGAVEHLLIMDAFGEALVLEPYLATAVIGGGFLQKSSSPLASDLLAATVAGQARFAFAQAEAGARFSLTRVETRAVATESGYHLAGAKILVSSAKAATYLLVTARTGGDPTDPAGISVFVVPIDAPGVARQDRPTIDGRGVAEFCFDGVVLPREANLFPDGDGLASIEAVVDEATAAVCAEAVGVMRRLLADTLRYTRERKQFGSALADFQALQHRMVDMRIKLDKSAGLAFLAAGSLREPPARRAAAVSAAKAFVGRAIRSIGQEAVQLHGAMGMTDELMIGHLFRRGTVIEAEFGSTDFHIDRFQRLGGGDHV